MVRFSGRKRCYSGCPSGLISFCRQDFFFKKPTNASGANKERAENPPNLESLSLVMAGIVRQDMFRGNVVSSARLRALSGMVSLMFQHQ